MKIAGKQNIVFLTGAGISVASGIRPFRGEGGLWNEVDPRENASAAALQRNFAKVFVWHQAQAEKIATAAPNAAHLAIAQLERQHTGAVTVLTQNVDSLHQKAGSTRVVEVHGSLRELRCKDEACGSKREIDLREKEPPLCGKCGKRMRHDVTMFDEPMPLDPLWNAKHALRACQLFIAVGTSGVVSPAAEFVREAHYAGAHTVLINAEPHQNNNRYFIETIIGKAEEILPALLLT